MRLAGARALVTGASSGIGREVAQSLAAAGCSLLLTGRDTAALARVAAATGGLTVAADLSEMSGVALLADTAASWALPDLVVHCAGIGAVATAGAQDDGGIERLLGTNLFAPVRLTRLLLPAMAARGSGRLVFVTSIAGVLGVPEESAYAASKAAVAAFAASLRLELAGSGVGVTTVIPGVVDTPFFDRRGAAYTRGFPRPIPAARVAAALVRGVERDRAQVVVPAWLRIPVILQACVPNTYARLASRWA